jgi:glycosyltransferase involved in cell wall biosynthesis
MVKIALIYQEMGFGGIQRWLADLSRALEERGHEVLIITEKPETPAYAFGGTITPIMKKASKSVLMRSFCWFFGLASIKRAFKADLSISAPDWCNALNLLCGKERKIITLHNIRTEYEMFPSRRTRLIEGVFTRLIKKAAAIVCVSRAIEAKATELYKNGRIRTLYNGIDLDGIRAEMDKQPAEAEDIGGAFLGRYAFVHVARLCPQKAQDRLLRAFKRVHEAEPRARLLLLGSGDAKGDDEATLRALAEALGVSDAVCFAGFTQNPFWYMARCRAFVLSSDHEGFGLVLPEALACGTPVISTDCPAGPREILAPDTDFRYATQGVERARYGLLTALSEEWLAEGMLALLTDDALHAQVAARARGRADDFAAEAWGAQWDALIKEVVAS